MPAAAPAKASAAAISGRDGWAASARSMQGRKQSQRRDNGRGGAPVGEDCAHRHAARRADDEDDSGRETRSFMTPNMVSAGTANCWIPKVWPRQAK